MVHLFWNIFFNLMEIKLDICLKKGESKTDYIKTILWMFQT